jgi:hypothetical protein
MPQKIELFGLNMVFGGGSGLINGARKFFMDYTYCQVYGGTCDENNGF